MGDEAVLSGPSFTSPARIDKGKRNFLIGVTAVAGGVFGASVAAPFLLSMQPSARARAAGAPVEVDISKIEPGAMMTVEWRGKPVWIVNRTPAMIESLAKDQGSLPTRARRVPINPSTARTRTVPSSRSFWS